MNQSILGKRFWHEEKQVTSSVEYTDPTQSRVNELVAALRAEVDKVEQLGEALISRDVIGQAKGMLMQRFTIDANAAFGILQETSNRLNVKLHEVAHQLVRNRTIDRYPYPS